jgi:hypothetical protein
MKVYRRILLDSNEALIFPDLKNSQVLKEGVKCDEVFE